jgi:hypothetical protein
MVERDYLVQALDDLGYEGAEEGKLSAFGPEVEIKINNRVGFRREGNGYAMVTRGLGEHRASQILNAITQRYVYHAAREKLEAQGFALASEEEQEGRIHLVLRRMA